MPDKKPSRVEVKARRGRIETNDFIRDDSMPMPRILARLVLAALALNQATAASANHTFSVSPHDFDDTNGNGLVDCGETLTFEVGAFDDQAPVGPVFRGRLTIPLSSSRFSYTSSEIDFLLTHNCGSPTFTPFPGGTFVDYDCTASPSPNSDNYAVAILVHGIYTGPSGAAILTAKDDLENPPTTLTATGTETRIQDCLVADLSLSKSDGGISVHAGDTVPYALNYQNEGNIAVLGRLQETVPANTVFSSGASSPGWTCTPSTAAGSSCTLDVSVPIGGSGAKIFAATVLPTTPPSVRLITNTASVTVLSPINDTNPANDTASDTTPVIPGTPSLAVTKTLQSSGGAPGTVAVFNITVANQGDGLAQSVTLIDSVPNLTTFLPAQSSAGWTCPSNAAGSGCSASLGDLIPGASVSRIFAVKLDASFPAGTNSVINSACASADAPPPLSPGPRLPPTCGSATAPVTASPNLTIAKTLSSGSGTPGSTLVYNLKLTNSGNQDSAATLLQETVPANTTFTAAQSDPGWSCAGNAGGSPCTLSVPSIPGAGGTLSRSYAVTIVSPLPAGVTSIANTACDGSACDTIQVPTDGTPQLRLTKTIASGTPTPGATLVYQLALQNLGNQATTPPTVLQETIPTNATFNAGQSDPAWSCAASTPGSSCSLSAGSIAGGGGTATYLFAVTIANPLSAGVATIGNTACVTPASGSPTCDQIQTPPNASPLLAVTKTRTSPAPSPGQVVTYSIAATNTGNQDAAGVVLTEQVPAGTSFEAPSSDSAWTCSPPTCTLTLATLPAGATATRVFAVRLQSPFPANVSSVTNTVCAADVPQRNVCATITDPPGAGPVLSLKKTYAGGPLAPGATLVFDLEVANSGDLSANAVRLDDTVPQHSSFLAASSDPSWSCPATTAGTTCSLTLASVAPGAHVHVAFAVRADSPLPSNLGQIANAACLFDGNASRCDQTTTPLPVHVDVTLDDVLSHDADGDSILDNGDVISYTLIVTNPTSLPAQGLQITTALDPRLGLVVGSVTADLGVITAGNSSGNTSPIVTLGSLPPGAPVTIHFDALAVDLAGLGPRGYVSTQSRASGQNFTAVPSDDPATADVVGDPTRTPLGAILTPSIPTLGDLGLATLTLLLGGCGFSVMRRRRKTA
jgi:uncharacterized repeat protein (TIGR01451 family)